jgi:hypothetical protein
MDESAPTSSHRQMKFYKILFALLILVALGGVGLTDFSPARSHLYWLSLVPVFAGACLLLEWMGLRGKGLKWTHVLRVQLLLWLSLAVGVLLVYMLLHSGRLNNENTGLIILLMLAMTTFAAGVQLGPLVMLLGCFLGLSLVLAAYVKSYVWMIMIGVAVGMAVLFYVFRRRSAA